MCRCGRIRQHTFDERGLFVGRFLRATCHGGRVFKLLGHFVAGFHAVEAWVVVFQTFQLVVRCFQCLVRHEQHVQTLLDFDLGNLGALFVQQERRHFHRHLGIHGRCVVLHGLFLDDAQDLQGRALGVTHVAGATATWARNGCTFAQRRAQALTAHFHQTEFANRAELHAGAVMTQRIAQAVFHVTAVAAFVHVNEVDDDQTAQVAQAHLAGHFVSSLEVGACRGFFNVTTFNGAGRVDVH